MTVAIYTGRFDPVTAGHLDIVSRAAKLFDTVIVAVFEAPGSQTTFSAEERRNLFEEAVGGKSGIEVRTFSGLAVDYARHVGASAMVRGVRMNLDFEHEFEMALMNRQLAPDIDVVCLITDIQYQFVRASLLKEVARLGGNISGLAPPNVIAALAKRSGS